jgi:hypothetical protein
MALAVLRLGAVLLLLSCSIVDGGPLKTLGRTTTAAPSDPEESPASTKVIDHVQFTISESDGAIRSKTKPDVYFSVNSSDESHESPVILQQCHGLGLELFDMSNNLIRVRDNKDFCLNVEGGFSWGNRIVTWACEQDGTALQNEEFQHGTDGRIRLVHHPDACINVKHSKFDVGAELIIWQCGEGDDDNDVFDYDDGLFKVRKHPDYHLRIQAKDTQAPGPLVLSHCLTKADEKFELLPNGQLRLKENPVLCLNVKGGPFANHAIIAWPCALEDPPDNERFAYDPVKHTIHLVKDPNLVFNAVGGALHQGDQIVLWPLVPKHGGEL